MSKLIILIAALAAPIAIPKSLSPRERAAAERVTEGSLAAHIRFLADDLLEGRAPASRGSDLAMRYIAAAYERLGLQGAGDQGGYLQKFEIVGLTSHVTSPPTLTPVGGGPSILLRPNVDSMVAPGMQQAKMGVQNADVVFVGYGITAPEQKWDDFKDVDVRGKVLLVMNNDPEDDPTLFAGKTRLYYGRWSYKYEEAARKGAAGVIIIHTTPSAGYPWQVVQSSWSGEAFELPAKDEPRLAVRMWATEEASRQIARAGGQDLDELRRAAQKRDFRPVALGVKLSVALATKVRRLETANVLGLLPGGDPKLAPEVVVYSAHHDHLGIKEIKAGEGKPCEGGKCDTIYNGALDNASGVSAMLTVAQAMADARPRPKRSILFAAVAAEESGLIGSEYLCAHPPVPAGRIAADINIDGINIWGRTRDITFIGLGKSSLDDVITTAARQQGRVVKPDQFPDRGGFYRSDQFSFARLGVPSIYLHAGTEFPGHDPAWGRERIEEYERTRYHQPSDQIDASWRLDGAVEDVRLMLVVGLRVADAPSLPSWKKGDEFEAARLRALGQAAPPSGGR